MDFLEQAKHLSDSALAAAQTIKTGAEAAAAGARQTAEEIASSGLEQVQTLQQTAQAATQQHLETIGKTVEDWQAALISSAAAGASLANALQELPRTAQALAQEMPKIAQRLRTGAGVRVGDAARSDADVMALFNKIPGTSKLGADEQSIRIFLSDKHGSHIHPRSMGGGNGADNILWEVGSDNLRRGAEVMTGGEQLYIRCYNAVDSLLKNSTTIASLGLAATGTAVLTQT
ncbi:MAG TPA: HNH endonuclease, partial [Trichocoleus sp.]